MKLFRWLKKKYICSKLNICFDCGYELTTDGCGDVSWRYCLKCNEEYWNKEVPRVLELRQKEIEKTRAEFFPEKAGNQP